MPGREAAVRKEFTADSGNGRQDVTVLVLAADSSLRSKLAALLEPHCRRVLTAAQVSQASQLLAERHPELLVLELSEQGRSVTRLIRAARKADPWCKVLSIVPAQDVQRAADAIKAGAFDCLSKPLRAERFLASAKWAVEQILNSSAGVRGKGRIARCSNGKSLVGQSRAMRHVWERIEMVKDVTSNVLIHGETGTGKELVAYAIHDSSPRADRPFVKLNCGAIPKDLLESELFGHEKGSFTGALQQRIGRFEMADGGTLLLDEIGDMPLDLQVKLLGVLQDRVVQRVGGHEKIPVDVRIIAATHQDLGIAMEEKRFREDLYYRLKVITIHVPPLRQHKEDIPLLVKHFVKLYSSQTGRDVTGVDEDGMKILMTYDYPGNVRELENIIESGVVLCSGRQITSRELPQSLTRSGTGGNEIVVRPGMPLSEVERLCIIETLRYTQGNKQQAAELLGINPRSIYRKIQHYEISLEPLLKEAS